MFTSGVVEGFDYKVRLMEILVVSELLTLRVRVTAHKRGSVLLNWLPRVHM